MFSIAHNLGGPPANEAPRFSDAKRSGNRGAKAWKQEVEDAPLLSRGWVVQERFLSSRMLHFGRTQLFWECNETKACEMHSETLPLFINQGSGKYYFHDRDMSFSGLDQDTSGEQLWLSVVGAFSIANLTNSTDKLPALSGLAKHVQKLMQDEYVAGHWKRNLAHQLLWTSRFARQRNQVWTAEYRAPSWSWASADGKIDMSFWIAERWPDMEDCMKILDVQITPKGIDPTGAVVTGFLRVQGPLNRVTLRGADIFLGESKVSGEVKIDIFPIYSDDDFFTIPIFECSLMSVREPTSRSDSYNCYFSSLSVTSQDSTAVAVCSRHTRKVSTDP